MRLRHFVFFIVLGAIEDVLLRSFFGRWVRANVILEGEEKRGNRYFEAL